MSQLNIDGEDLALVVSLLVAILAALVDTFYGGLLFKALKIVALFLSLGLAVHRIRTGKPYYKDVAQALWIKANDQFRVEVPRSEHKRGRFPQARVFVPGDSGGFAEAFADIEVSNNGNVVVQVAEPLHLRVEVRK